MNASISSPALYSASGSDSGTSWDEVKGEHRPLLIRGSSFLPFDAVESEPDDESYPQRNDGFFTNRVLKDTLGRQRKVPPLGSGARIPNLQLLSETTPGPISRASSDPGLSKARTDEGLASMSRGFSALGGGSWTRSPVAGSSTFQNLPVRFEALNCSPLHDNQLGTLERVGGYVVGMCARGSR
jgi:hypothetical protein